MYVLSSDADDDILVTFEFPLYSVTEGQPSVEVCAVTSATPFLGLTVTVQLSTVDGTATGTYYNKHAPIHTPFHTIIG